MDLLHSVTIPTNHGDKQISVFAANILCLDRPIDILTTSAYAHAYYPTPNTLFCALDQTGISVQKLAEEPEFDLRAPCNIWLSQPLSQPKLPIRRIGCVEMEHTRYTVRGLRASMVNEQKMFQSIKAYFQMLDLAATCGVKMETVAIPVLGTGSQSISQELVLIPLLRECVQFLKRNSAVKQLLFIEKDPQKAFKVAQALQTSYAVRQEQAPKESVSSAEKKDAPLAFISYASPDRNVADNLCAKLEANGIKVWYAPRNVHGDYASSIAEAIMQATHFIVILSKNSMASQHVLNEIDLAFKKLPNHIRFQPLRIDEEKFAPAFEYYLSRQHWMDAYIPPLEERLNEFICHFEETL